MVRAGVDATGRGVVVWHEGAWTNLPMRYRVLPAGASAFEEAIVVPGTESGVLPADASLGRDGRLTVGYQGQAGVGLTTGLLGSTLVATKPYGASCSNCGVFFGAAPGGRSIVGWLSDPDHMLTAGAGADGELGPPQDVRRDCGHVAWAGLAINDAGVTAAALMHEGRLWLTRQEPWTGPGLQECLPDSAYGRMPGPVGAGEVPIPDPSVRWMPPSDSPSPKITVDKVVLEGTGRSRIAKFRVRCDGPCLVGGSGRLVKSGRRLARGRTNARAVSKHKTLRMRLKVSRRTQRALRSPSAKRRLRLVLRLEAVGRRGGHRVRTITVRPRVRR